MHSCDIEFLFSELFSASENTVLVGGAPEPLYLPANMNTSGIALSTYHRIFYLHQSPSSAMHEIAHWCLAGARRRLQQDYGYWYCPDGRSAEQQRDFEEVEVRPQALEAILDVAAGIPFVVSIDNLGGQPYDEPLFRERIEHQKNQFLSQGLPRRASLFRDYLFEFKERCLT